MGLNSHPTVQTKRLFFVFRDKNGWKDVERVKKQKYIYLLLRVNLDLVINKLKIKKKIEENYMIK